MLVVDQVTKSLAEAHLTRPVHLVGPLGLGLTFNSGVGLQPLHRARPGAGGAGGGPHQPPGVGGLPGTGRPGGGGPGPGAGRGAGQPGRPPGAGAPGGGGGLRHPHPLAHLQRGRQLASPSGSSCSSPPSGTPDHPPRDGADGSRAGSAGGGGGAGPPRRRSGRQSGVAAHRGLPGRGGRPGARRAGPGGRTPGLPAQHRAARRGHAGRLAGVGRPHHAAARAGGRLHGASTRTPTWRWSRSRPGSSSTPAPAGPPGPWSPACSPATPSWPTWLPRGCASRCGRGIVHRLDEGTSGLLAVARSERAYRSLVDQLAARTVDRSYLALVHGLDGGRPGCGGRADRPLGPSAHPDGRVRAGPRGQHGLHGAAPL